MILRYKRRDKKDRINKLGVCPLFPIYAYPALENLFILMLIIALSLFLCVRLLLIIMYIVRFTEFMQRGRSL